MIHRIVIFLLILMVLSDLYVDVHYFRKRYPLPLAKRLLWWVPCTLMVIYTVILASLPDFAPDNLFWQNTYLILFGILVIPKGIFAICSLIGSLVRLFLIRTNRNWGHIAGIFLGLIAIITYLYGFFIGFKQICVKHVDLYFKDLPIAFNGYKIVHISDMHIGTFTGWRRKILLQELDSINKQHADIILFTGDLENVKAKEVKPFVPLLNKQLPSVVAIRGNHDYAAYLLHATEEQKTRQTEELRTIIKNDLHWKLLENEHITITKKQSASAESKTDTLYIIGTEDDGKEPGPIPVNYQKATKGIKQGAFSILLQHEPAAWRKNVLPKTSARLTLSGHTHGGQMQFLGIRPTNLMGHEDLGLYEQAGRYLYVTAGLGGLVPLRINMPNEVTVITLHKK